MRSSDLLDLLFERFTEGQRLIGAHQTAKALACWVSALETADSQLRRNQAGASREIDLSMAGLCTQIGDILRDQGEIAEALKYYERAARITEFLNPKSIDHAACLRQVAGVLKLQGHFSRALPLLQRTLKICESVPTNPRLLAMCLDDLGGIFSAQGDLVNAINHYRQALAVVERSDPNSPSRAAYLNNLGRAHEDRGDLVEARQNFERACGIIEEIEPESKSHAIYLSNLGLLHQDLGDLEKAQQYLDRSADILGNAAPRSIEYATALNNVGGIYLALGDLEQARQFYERASRIVQEIASTSPQFAASLHSVGKICHLTGALETALEYFRRALTRDEEIASESHAVARDLNSIGMVLRELGDLTSAIEALRKAVAILNKVEPRSLTIAAVINNLGLVYEEQGRSESARDCFRRAIEIASDVAPQSENHATYLNNLGGLSKVAGDLQEASVLMQRAVTIWRDISPTSASYALGMSNVGMLYCEAGDQERAMDYLLQAAAIKRSTAPKSIETAHTLQNLGWVAEHAHKVDDAEMYYKESLAILLKSAPQSRTMALCLSNLGGIYFDQGDWQRAIEFWSESTRVIEYLRSHSGGDQPRESMFSQPEFRTPYEGIITSLLRRSLNGDRELAFHFAERSRARNLLDLLAEGHVQVRAETAAQRGLLDAEKSVRFRLAAAHNQLAELVDRPGYPEDLITRLKGEERKLEEEADSIRAQIRRDFPAYGRLEYPEPLTLHHVQQRLLDEKTLLLEYSLGYEPCVWAVRRDDFEMVPMDLAKRQFEELIGLAIGRYHGQQVAGDVEHEARAGLARRLLRGVPERLWKGVDKLLVVPDGALYYLPFEILPWDGQLLGEVFSVVYAPSATTVDNIRERWQEQTRDYIGEFVGFGDPAFRAKTRDDEGEQETLPTATRCFSVRGMSLERLPGTRIEVEAIAKQFGASGKVYLDYEATEWKAKTKTEGYRFVHFATHGLLDDINPMYSGLAFAPRRAEEPTDGDDMLQVHEMFGMKLSAEFVVCSACQTGLGAIRAGEGLVGMSRGLFFAGAKCLILSLWSVPDAATAQLMRWFYDGVASRQETVVDALKAAKIRMKRVQPDPYYWAAFVVVGTS